MCLVQGAAFELEGLEVDAKTQESATKEAVEKAKDTAKAAIAADVKLMEEQVITVLIKATPIAFFCCLM